MVVLTVLRLKEPWVFSAPTQLFTVICNVVVVQLGYVDGPQELGADTEQGLSALKCDENSACSSN